MTRATSQTRWRFHRDTRKRLFKGWLPIAELIVPRRIADLSIYKLLIPNRNGGNHGELRLRHRSPGPQEGRRLSGEGDAPQQPGQVQAALRLLLHASSCWRHAPTPTANIIHNSDPNHG
jgi:hypothetical protein